MAERTIKLTVSYDGTSYSGFQRQKREKTVQQTLEKALQTICEEKITVIGAGRTDAGVHAIAQVCHFKTHSRIPRENLRKGINSLLPSDISIQNAQDMPEDFHARHSAVQRAYAYFIFNHPLRSCFFDRYVLWVPELLDIEKMQDACRFLVGKKDFSSFCGASSDKKDPWITVTGASCFPGTGSFQSPVPNDKRKIITFCIEAQSFLYNMVRILVGTLLEIGKGKKVAAEMELILHARDRKQAGPTAHPRGLFLVNVAYPEKFS